ncbi:MAG: hypothetical protein CMR00_08250 [[Chlorobium] sp. 445]|nr:MAG: hypothetical protein CMR00_08250 [[Chlorobium] sp. 445]
MPRITLAIGLLGILHLCVACDTLLAQQKIGFIDSQVIIDALPEAQDAKRKLEALSNEWQAEIKRNAKTWRDFFKTTARAKFFTLMKSRSKSRMSCLLQREKFQSIKIKNLA